MRTCEEWAGYIAYIIDNAPPGAGHKWILDTVEAIRLESWKEGMKDAAAICNQNAQSLLAGVVPRTISKSLANKILKDSEMKS